MLLPSLFSPFYILFSLGLQSTGWCHPPSSIFPAQLNHSGQPSLTHPEACLLGYSDSSHLSSEINNYSLRQPHNMPGLLKKLWLLSMGIFYTSGAVLITLNSFDCLSSDDHMSLSTQLKFEVGKCTMAHTCHPLSMWFHEVLHWVQ